MGKLYKRDGRWGIDYVDANNQRVRKIVSGDKSVAQVFLSEAMKAVEKQKAGVLQADPREGKKTFEKQVDAYLAEGDVAFLEQQPGAERGRGGGAVSGNQV